MFRLIYKTNFKCRTNKIIRCQDCKVEVIPSKVRRYRLGFIKLHTPIVHIWYFRIPNYIALLLDNKIKDLEKIIYLRSYVKLKKKSKFTKMNWICHKWYHNKSLIDALKNNPGFTYITGAEGIQEMLIDLDLNKISNEIINRIKLFDKSPELRAVTRNYESVRKRLIRRFRIINHFIKEKNKPEWMILNYLPVLPPDLRPILMTKGGVRRVLN